MKKPFFTLGIETSCDETSIAVFHSDKGIISQALFSQIKLHAQFGGVIPEFGSRSQLEQITPVLAQALAMANLSLNDIDVIAVTNKPGLAGSLLVGVCFAKAIAWGLGKKLIGVNHLEGHAFSAFLEHDIPFTHLCLTASGGHTSLYLVEDFGVYTTIGTTQDDAAGEAFDKIAKLLELPYPGGPEIEKLAKEVDFKDFFLYPRGTLHSLDFSFSGLKTAVLYHLVKIGAYDLATKKLLDTSRALKQRVASSLLVCIADIFERKIISALTRYPDVQAVTFVGGVACNNYIKSRLQVACMDRKALPLYSPSFKYCTDNGGMIAFVGNYKAKNEQFSDLFLDILR